MSHLDRGHRYLESLERAGCATPISLSKSISSCDRDLRFGPKRGLINRRRRAGRTARSSRPPKKDKKDKGK